MARQRTKRLANQQKAERRKKRKSKNKRKTRRSRSTYRHGLVEAIAKWFPGQFFSRWPLSAKVKWSPQRLFWMAILMTWSADQTLQARFEEARDVLRALFPKWPLGKTYTGWYDAQLEWLEPLQPA